MTNKQKAEKIYLSISPDYKYGAYAGAMKMAEWKDKQFKKILKEECNTSYESGLSEGERKAEVRFKAYLEKKLTEQNEIFQNKWRLYDHYDWVTEGKSEIIDEIINELFKEA